jgi:hypothetical protein
LGDHAPLGFGPEIDNTFGATTTIDHSIVQGSGGSAAWNPAFGTDGGGNLDVDPRLGPLLASNFSSMQTLLPGTGSPAIDAGNDASCPSRTSAASCARKARIATSALSKPSPST